MKLKVKLTTAWCFRPSVVLPPGLIGVLNPTSLGDTDEVAAINYTKTQQAFDPHTTAHFWQLK